MASAATSAATPATSSAVTYPAQETLPGPANYNTPTAPMPAGEGPVSLEPNPLPASNVPGIPVASRPGGGRTLPTPVEAWDGNTEYGAYVAPALPGAVNPQLHQRDTGGGVKRLTKAPNAGSNPVTMLLTALQTTFLKNGSQTIRDFSTAYDNNRTGDYIRVSGKGGIDTRGVEFAVRPLQNNVAFQNRSQNLPDNGISALQLLDGTEPRGGQGSLLYGEPPEAYTESQAPPSGDVWPEY